MKIVKTMFYTVVFLFAVFIASFNTATVYLVYLPALPFLARPEGAVLQLPLFVVILGSVLLGVIIGGAGAFIEHLRLRATLRAEQKQNGSLLREVTKVKDELERALARAGDSPGPSVASNPIVGDRALLSDSSSADMENT
ncbi:MAG: lipopolysaccharide assembly protein LapA domain-containing protein [Candidatus Binatia bacterium]